MRVLVFPTLTPVNGRVGFQLLCSVPDKEAESINAAPEDPCEDGGRRAKGHCPRYTATVQSHFLGSELNRIHFISL